MGVSIRTATSWALPISARRFKTFNIAPTWTRVISSSTVFTLGGFVRRDQYNYYPSGNPFADLGPSNLQQETVAQNRTLTNAGLRASLSYVKGIHNVKAGATYQQTFLTENDNFGIVDPTFNAVCLNADETLDTDPTLTNPAQCGGAAESRWLAESWICAVAGLLRPDAHGHAP